MVEGADGNNDKAKERQFQFTVVLLFTTGDCCKICKIYFSDSHGRIPRDMCLNSQERWGLKIEL